MKKIANYILFIALMGFLSTAIFAQSNVSKDALKGKIDEIFKLANKQKYKEITGYIIYTGDNAERKYKASLNANDPGELKKAERLAKKMHAYIDISDEYELKNFTEETKDDIKMINATVAFKSGAQLLDIDFVFVDNNGNIMLVDID